MSRKYVIGKVPDNVYVKKNVGTYYICAIIKDEHPYVRE